MYKNSCGRLRGKGRGGGEDDSKGQRATVLPGSEPPHTSVLRVIRTEWQIRGNFLNQAIARAGPSHNYHVELLYQRRTRRARSVFQRLALPTPVSISNGICSR